MMVLLFYIYFFASNVSLVSDGSFSAFFQLVRVDVANATAELSSALGSVCPARTGFPAITVISEQLQLPRAKLNDAQV